MRSVLVALVLTLTASFFGACAKKQAKTTPAGAGAPPAVQPTAEDAAKDTGPTDSRKPDVGDDAPTSTGADPCEGGE